MFELCALLRSPKVAKPRKAAAPKISAGKVVKINGVEVTVVDRDERYANAWFVTNGTKTTSVSRDMIQVAA